MIGAMKRPDGSPSSFTSSDRESHGGKKKRKKSAGTSSKAIEVQPEIDEMDAEAKKLRAMEEEAKKAHQHKIKQERMRSKYFGAASRLIDQAIEKLVEKKNLEYTLKFMVWRTQHYSFQLLGGRTHGGPVVGSFRERRDEVLERLPQFRERLIEMDHDLFHDTDQVCVDHTFLTEKERLELEGEEPGSKKRSTSGNKKRKAKVSKKNVR